MKFLEPIKKNVLVVIQHCQTHWKAISDVDPDLVGSAFRMRIQKNKMNGKSEFNKQIFYGFFIVEKNIFQI